MLIRKGIKRITENRVVVGCYAEEEVDIRKSVHVEGNIRSPFGAIGGVNRTSKEAKKARVQIVRPKASFLLKACVLMAFLSFGINCQIFGQKEDKTQYGLKAGINFAELFGDDAIPESDRKVGYSFGAYAAIKLSEDFKIQSEVIWSLQGEKSEDKGRYDISYLNIPIMFKWTNKKLYTELGPQLGLQTINTSKSVPDDIRLENFETFDLSLNAGVGYAVFEDWSVGMRYCQGITNLVEGRDLKNSVIYFGVSYRLF